ncbi:MAG: hypothetical protein ABIU87_09170 [Ornithinibacter sp.]
MTRDEVRTLALGMVDVAEHDHHGFPSFRAGPKQRIFATLPTADVLRVMLDEGGIREAVGANTWCREGWWGRTLSTVEVVLADADAGIVAELLAEGHARAQR